MDQDHSLSHHERLRSHGRIKRLFELGKSGFVYPVRYVWYAEPQGDEEQETEQNEIHLCEVLFTVPKRFHKRANKRNLLRRKVKESYRLQKSIVLSKQGEPQKIDLAMIYSTKDVRSYKTINHAVHKILENIASDL